MKWLSLILLIAATCAASASTPTFEYTQGDEKISSDGAADGFTVYAKKVSCRDAQGQAQIYAVLYKNGGLKVQTHILGLCKWDLRQSESGCQNDDSAETVACWDKVVKHYGLTFDEDPAPAAPSEAAPPVILDETEDSAATR